jgi:hypothetical protein
MLVNKKTISRIQQFTDALDRIEIAIVIAIMVSVFPNWAESYPRPKLPADQPSPPRPTQPRKHDGLPLMMA